MEKFNEAFRELIGNEGGYKCEATDRMDWTGGKIGLGKLVGTKYGISAGTYPMLDIKNLTLDQARNIYKRDWWDQFYGDLFPYELSFQIFDSEINHGHKMGVKFLQRALKFTGDDIDGVVGPMTINAANKYDEDKLIMRFLAVRMKYFTSISTWATYGKGWANRIADNLIKATEPNF